MPSMFRGPLAAGLIATSMLCAAADASAGAKIVRGTASSADAVTTSPTLVQQAFMRARYWRMRTFSPYFDARRSWAPGAWVTQHAYALDADTLAAHPEWQLRDSVNTPLFIGTQAAADVGNADFRAWWIARAQAAVGVGYKGLFIDDVFMERRTYLAGGTLRVPKDPRTNATMTEANWQKYMADFVVAVRAALPNAEIVHDVLWAKGDAGDVLRGLSAANYVSVDGGFSANVVTSSFATLAGWAEREQVRGGGVVFASSTAVAASRLYELASYLLVDNGASAIANDAATAPGAFWSGYDVDLGTPTTGRYQVMTGVWRRDWTRGIVLVNEPYRSTRTLTVPAGFQDLDGVVRTSVTLAGGQGVVLVPAPPAPVATPTPTPVPPVKTPEPVKPTAPVAVSTPTPVATPPVLTTVTREDGGAARARAAGTAGAREPGGTSVAVRGSAVRLSGRVTGAVSGSVRLTVERKRGTRWVFYMRTKGTVQKSGSFLREIPRLRKGTYRVSGFFEGTGTSKPSRSSAKPFQA